MISHLLKGSIAPATDWYRDQDINTLMHYYFADHPNVDVIASLLGTNWQGEEGIENTLRANLQEFDKQRIAKLATANKLKNHIIVPINLYQNHWVLVYMLYEHHARQPSAIYYFDPLGAAINLDVKQAITSTFPQAKLINIATQKQYDGYNCGPWIIEAARSFVATGVEPHCDIHLARQEHTCIREMLAQPLPSTPLSPSSIAAKATSQQEYANNRNSINAELTNKNVRWVNNKVDALLDEILLKFTDKGADKWVAELITLGEKAYQELNNPSLNSAERIHVKRLQHWAKSLSQLPASAANRHRLFISKSCATNAMPCQSAMQVITHPQSLLV